MTSRRRRRYLDLAERGEAVEGLVGRKVRWASFRNGRLVLEFEEVAR
jgi:hypothetical protein